MKTRLFQGRPISALGLGSLTWGRDTDDFEAREQIEVFFEAGGSLVDTSAEFNPNVFQIIQVALKGKPRDSYQISLHLQTNENRRLFVDKVQSILVSLEIDHIDYLVVEPIMSLEMWPNISQEIIKLYDDRKVDGVMFRNVPAWKSVRLQADMRDALYAGEHFNYSLLDGEAEERLQQVAAKNRRIFATAALASGVLTGKYRATIPADSRAASPHLQARTKKYFTPSNLAIVEAVEKAAQGLGVSSSTIALAWLLNQEQVGAAIIGPRTVAQLRAILSEIDFDLPETIRDALNDVIRAHQA